MANELPQVMSGSLVGFKVGTQAQIDAVLLAGSGAQHGTFYLAKDTHRLYVGNEDTSLSPVNEGVRTVEYLTSSDQGWSAGHSTLPAKANAVPGEFYYVSTKNILCTYNGTDWVQINSNTDHDVASVAFGAGANTGEVTLAVQTYDESTNTYSSAKSGKMTITGANGVGVAVTGSGDTTTVTVTGDQYSLSNSVADSKTATINLNSSATNNDTSVTLKAGDNVSLAAVNGNIQISAENTINSISSVTINENTTGDTHTTGFDITVAESEGTSATGHLDPEIAYGADGTTSVKFDNGKATLPVYSKEEIDHRMQALDSMRYIGTIGNDANATVAIPGTVDPASFPITVQIGDTFKIQPADGKNIQTGTNTTTKANQNAILIANGTEYKYVTGQIPSGVTPDPNEVTSNAALIGTINPSTLHFDIIQATNDQNTQYTFQAKNDATDGAGVILRNVTDSLDVASLRVKAGTALAIDSALNDDSANQTVVIKHANKTPTNGTATHNDIDIADNTANSFVVNDYTFDAQGHIDTITARTINLADNGNWDFSSRTTSVAADAQNNKVTVSDAWVVNDGTGVSVGIPTASVAFSSDNDSLQISQVSNSNEVKINLVWGSM